jgi:hypothetical protein
VRSYPASELACPIDSIASALENVSEGDSGSDTDTNGSAGTSDDSSSGDAPSESSSAGDTSDSMYSTASDATDEPTERESSDTHDSDLPYSHRPDYAVRRQLGVIEIPIKLPSIETHTICRMFPETLYHQLAAAMPLLGPVINEDKMAFLDVMAVSECAAYAKELRFPIYQKRTSGDESRYLTDMILGELPSRWTLEEKSPDMHLRVCDPAPCANGDNCTVARISRGALGGASCPPARFQCAAGHAQHLFCAHHAKDANELTCGAGCHRDSPAEEDGHAMTAGEVAAMLRVLGQVLPGEMT